MATSGIEPATFLHNARCVHCEKDVAWLDCQVGGFGEGSLAKSPHLPTNLLKQISHHITPDLSLLQNWILSLVYRDLQTNRLPHSHSDINPQPDHRRHTRPSLRTSH